MNCKITLKTGSIFTRWGKKHKEFARLQPMITGYDRKGEHPGKEPQEESIF